MNVIALKTLRDFWTSHPTAKAPLAAWARIARAARWTSFAEVRATFNTADHVVDNKVVFNIGGNNFRLVAVVAYRSQRLFMLWIGTHVEYDKVNVGDL